MNSDPPLPEWDESYEKHADTNVGYGHRWPVEAFEPLVTVDDPWSVKIDKRVTNQSQEEID